MIDWWRFGMKTEKVSSKYSVLKVRDLNSRGVVVSVLSVNAVIMLNLTVLFTDQYPLLRSDSIVSPKKEEQHYSFIYIAHPRAVTGFSWRKTSKYMPRYTDDIPIEWVCNHILIVSQGKNFNYNEVAGIYFCCKVWKGEDSIWFFSSLTKFFKNWVIPLLKREKNELIR